MHTAYQIAFNCLHEFHLPQLLPFSFNYDNQVWRVPFNGDQCGDADSVDIGSQPKDLSLALHSPELALVSTDSGIVMLRGTKIVSTINLGFPVTASVIAPDGSEAIIGGQDGKLHIYSITGDTLTEDAVLEKHRGAVTVIRYSPDVSMFASGDANREAVVWDRASREVISLFPYFCFIFYSPFHPDSPSINVSREKTCIL